MIVYDNNYNSTLAEELKTKVSSEQLNSTKKLHNDLKNWITMKNNIMDNKWPTSVKDYLGNNKI